MENPTYTYLQDDPKAQAFIDDLIEVYKKHNLTLGHEDPHGGFLVQDFNQSRIDWLRDALVSLDAPSPDAK